MIQISVCANPCFASVVSGRLWCVLWTFLSPPVLFLGRTARFAGCRGCCCAWERSFYCPLVAVCAAMWGRRGGVRCCGWARLGRKAMPPARVLSFLTWQRLDLGLLQRRTNVSGGDNKVQSTHHRGPETTDAKHGFAKTLICIICTSINYSL